MSCPPECETSGMCVRACLPTNGPICSACYVGGCNFCDGTTWDEDTDEPTWCRCCGEDD